MRLEELDKSLFMNDYTLEDFKRESPERRREILVVSIVDIPRALVLLAMDSHVVYQFPNELYANVYERYFLGDCSSSLKKYRSFFPRRNSCWGYVDDRRSNYGSLTKEGITTKVKTSTGDIGYRLTSFGEMIKGFAAYCLKKYAMLDFNPSMMSYDRKYDESGSYIRRMRILQFLIENGGTASLFSIGNAIGALPSLIYPTADGLKQYGLVEYENPEIIRRNARKGNLRLRITERGKKIYEGIIVIIEGVVKNPDKILEYADYKNKLECDEIKKLLESYSQDRSHKGRRKERVYQTIEDVWKARGESLSIEEISERTGFKLQTVRGIVRNLLEEGFIRAEDKGRYRPI